MTQKTIKIILVEDQAMFRKGLISMFDEYDFFEVIAEAANGLELINLLKNSHAPDVILLDIKMPVMDGSETLDYMNENYPHIPVVMLTLYDEDILIEDYLLRGAKAFVSKSTDFDIMIETIKSIVDPSFNVKLNTCSVGDFTPREKEIIPHLCDGKTTEQIASHFNVAPKTIEGHRARLFAKTGSKSIQEFLRFAIDRGLQFLKKKHD